MRRIRINNDITIRVALFRNSIPEDTVGKEILMILRTPTYKTTLTAVVEDNIATAVWHAGDQQTVGTYIVTIVERVSTLNRDAERVGNKAMNVVDIGNAFELVPLNERPYEYDTDIESGCAIIELDANIQNPSNGLTAYELACIHGFRGTEAEWLRSLDPAWKKGWLNREHVSAEFMNMWDAVAKNAVQINTLQELLNQYYATMQNAISFRGDKEVVPAGETASITFTFDCINTSHTVVLNVYHGTTLVYNNNVSVFPHQFTLNDASEGVYRCEANVDGIKYVGLWEVKASQDFWVGTGSGYDAVIANPAFKHAGAASLSGTYFLNPSAGDYIYIVCKSNVVPASVTISGFEVPMSIAETIEIDGVEYAVYQSWNSYQAVGIELVVNSVGYDNESYIAHLIEEIVTLKEVAEEVETIADEETLTMTEDSKVAVKNRRYVATTSEVQGNKGYIILEKGQTFKEQIESVTEGNTIFEVRYDYDLDGETVEIPEGCTLKFEGGTISNGTLVGDGTMIDAQSAVFAKDVTISGTWANSIAMSAWFEKDTTENTDLFINLSVIADNIELEGIEYNILKNNTTINCKKLYSRNNGCVINFHCGTGGAKNDKYGLFLRGDDLEVYGITVTEDFVQGTTNNATIGCALSAVYDSDVNTYRLNVHDCVFTGSFASSPVSSSRVTDSVLHNCVFKDIYMADHAFYVSVKAKTFYITNCRFENAVSVGGLIKTRDSAQLQYVHIDSCVFINCTHFILVLGMGTSTSTLTVISNVNVVGHNGYFICANGGVNPNLIIRDCYLDNSSSSNPDQLVKGGSGTVSAFNLIIVQDTICNKLGLGGSTSSSSSNVVVRNSTFAGIATNNFSAYDNIEMNSCKIVATTGTSLFYRNSSVRLDNCVVDCSKTYLVSVPVSGDSILDFRITNTKIGTLGRNLFTVNAEGSPNFYFIEGNNTISANNTYPKVTAGNTTSYNSKIFNSPVGVNTTTEDAYKNVEGYASFATLPAWWNTKWIEADGAKAGVGRSGTFANKPAATDIYVGFKYFCTDKQTTEGATNGIEIIHKGSGVWVDALGRVVS